jgi:hypothetical protein
MKNLGRGYMDIQTARRSHMPPSKNYGEQAAKLSHRPPKKNRGEAKSYTEHGDLIRLLTKIRERHIDMHRLQGELIILVTKI